MKIGDVTLRWDIDSHRKQILLIEKEDGGITVDDIATATMWLGKEYCGVMLSKEELRSHSYKFKDHGGLLVLHPIYESWRGMK